MWPVGALGSPGDGQPTPAISLESQDSQGAPSAMASFRLAPEGHDVQKS